MYWGLGLSISFRSGFSLAMPVQVRIWGEVMSWLSFKTLSIIWVLGSVDLTPTLTVWPGKIAWLVVLPVVGGIPSLGLG